jgi:hypothetical protein
MKIECYDICENCFIENQVSLKKFKNHDTLVNFH